MICQKCGGIIHANDKCCKQCKEAIILSQTPSFSEKKRKLSFKHCLSFKHIVLIALACVFICVGIFLLFYYI